MPAEGLRDRSYVIRTFQKTGTVTGRRPEHCFGRPSARSLLHGTYATSSRAIFGCGPRSLFVCLIGRTQPLRGQLLELGILGQPNQALCAGAGQTEMDSGIITSAAGNHV